MNVLHLFFRYYTVGSLSYLSFSTTMSTYLRQISSVSASTITLITGSVPDSRTSIRPVSPVSYTHLDVYKRQYLHSVDPEKSTTPFFT